jgi:hypothetical protein
VTNVQRLLISRLSSFISFCRFTQQETKTQCLLLQASDHRRQRLETFLSDLQSDDAGRGLGRQQQLGAARASGSEAREARASGSEAGVGQVPGSKVEGGGEQQLREAPGSGGGARCRAAARGGAGVGGGTGCW